MTPSERGRISQIPDGHPCIDDWPGTDTVLWADSAHDLDAAIYRRRGAGRWRMRIDRAGATLLDVSLGTASEPEALALAASRILAATAGPP